MRVIAGEFRGRRLTAPKGESTRPTTGRVREALFSSLSSHLGPRLGGGRGLDAFAGSGALGLEALSRGLNHVTFVENDRSALSAVDANVAALGVGARTTVSAGDVVALAERGAIPGGPFSLLLLDPPYRLASSEIARLVAALSAHDLLEDESLIVYEHAARGGIQWPAGVLALANKRYGTTEIDIASYVREAGPA